MKKRLVSTTLNRRHFLRGTASAVAGVMIMPRHVLGGPSFVAPSDKVNVALIGCGAQGFANARALFNQPDAQIIAVADPIESHNFGQYLHKGSAGRIPTQEQIEAHYAAKSPNYKVAAYADYREMLEKEKAIDAIVCATPDHHHAGVSITAMRLGKHVYCEKPLSHNVWEARQMAQVARETRVATQMGNQGHSDDHIRNTCEWIWAGAIGDVYEVQAWTGASRYNKKHIAGMPPESPIPPGVDWDLWVGPRAMRPFSLMYPRLSWRDFWDFGTAPIGDFFCHNFDPACWALDLREPLTVEAWAAGGVDPCIAPVGGIYNYHFGARGRMPPVKFTWSDGGLRPPLPEGLEEGDRIGGNTNGILFFGTKGMLTCPGWAGRPSLLPGSKDEAYQRPPKTLPRSNGHHRDWLDACKGGKPASANFEYGAGLTEVGLLGLVALRVGRQIKWDAKAMKATNAPEADKFLKETYRFGWEIT